MGEPTISVIVVARNEARNVERCVGALKRQRGGEGLDVLLVDSSSDDGTPDLARQHGARVHTIRREDFHHSRTRNLGASLTRGETLVFLQGDAWPAHEGWLEELVSPLRADPTVACVYGRQTPKPECDPINRFRTGWNYGDREVRKSLALADELKHRLYFFSTANCAIRREIWEKYRFPEDVPIFEDTTFARRVIGDGGAILYNPRAEVQHSHNLGVWRILTRYYAMGFIQAQYAFTKNADKNFRSEGKQYLWRGMRQVREEAGWFWCAWFVAHTAAGYAGLVLGRWAHRLGLKLKA